MGIDGSGGFTRNTGNNTGSDAWTQDKLDSIKVSSSGHDQHDEEVAAALRLALYRDGRATATGNIPMGSYKLTGLGLGSAATDSASLQNIINYAPAVDGWVPITGTFAKFDANNITVDSGAASKYSVGDKIKLTDTTTKYFYITAIADTKLTVNGGSDYSLVGTISAGYYSKAASPLGFPHWFNYVPTTTSGVMTRSSESYPYAAVKLNGKTATVKVRNNFTAGGSAVNSVAISHPFTASAGETSGGIGTGIFVDTGGTPSQGIAQVFVQANTLTVFRTDTSNYTPSGAKALFVWAEFQLA